MPKICQNESYKAFSRSRNIRFTLSPKRDESISFMASRWTFNKEQDRSVSLVGNGQNCSFLNPQEKAVRWVQCSESLRENWEGQLERVILYSLASLRDHFLESFELYLFKSFVFAALYLSRRYQSWVSFFIFYLFCCLFENFIIFASQHLFIIYVLCSSSCSFAGTFQRLGLLDESESSILKKESLSGIQKGQESANYTAQYSSLQSLQSLQSFSSDHLSQATKSHRTLPKKTEVIPLQTVWNQLYEI